MTVPLGWRRVPISDLYLGLFDGPHGTPPPADAGRVFLGIGNLTEDGHLNLSNVRRIADKDFPNWTRRVTPQPGDIVFTYEATLNRYAIIPHGFDGCLGRRLALIRPNNQRVDTRFLLYSFFSSDWRKTIERHRLAGATVDRIPLTQFPNFPINMPPLEAQQRIADILSAYDDLIEVNQRRIAILEEMARRLFEEWFIRFRYPGHAGQSRGAEGDDPRPKWTKRSLGALARECGGEIRTGPFGSQLHQSDYEAEGVPVVMPANLASGRVDEDGIARISAETRDRLDTHILRAGDIVYGRRGDIGRKALVGPEQDGWICGTGCLRIRLPSGATDSYYLNHFLGRDDVRGLIAGQAIGATMPNLNTTILSNVVVVVPPMMLQAAFRRQVEPIDTLCRRLLRQNKGLRAARDLLLPKLISGEIDVCAAPAPDDVARDAA